MLIDTHAHLEMREFNDDRDDVIKRAKEAGVEYIVTIGTTVESSRDAVMLADKYDFIYAAIGIHPHEAKDILHPPTRSCATSPSTEGRGLRRDRARLLLRAHPAVVQQRKFRDMLHEAKELKLPIIVHDRDAHEDTIRILKEDWDPALGGVMHCFSGDIEYAKQVMDLGSTSPSPVRDLSEGAALRDVVKQVPSSSS